MCATCDVLRQLLIDRGMNPSLAMTIGSELGERAETKAFEAVEKVKRKASTYNRRYAAAYRRIKKKHTLKSGKMAKGYGGRRGHIKMVKMAHAEAKKGGRKR